MSLPRRVRRPALLIAAISALAASPLLTQAGSPVGATFCPPGVNPIPVTEYCGAALTPPQMSCYLPDDVEGALKQSNLNVVQRATDLFSWQQFIAVNWPALPGARGVPNPFMGIGSPGARVWETWKEPYEVYLPNGQKPPGWNQPYPMPSACATLTSGKVLMRTAKVNDLQDEHLQAAKTNGTLPATLTDQNGQLVRYEIRMNKTAFDYVVANGYYDGDNQKDVTDIDFPDGAILAKAAWRVVDAAEAGDFHSVEACVCDLGSNGQPDHCAPRHMGLVGFHLMTKTASAPQWIWSTFEQTRNVTPMHGLPASFYDPTRTGCVANAQTEPGTPNQVTRVIPIPSTDPVCSQTQAAVDNVVQLNHDVQTAFTTAGSVFANYELVNAQWPYPVSGATTPTEFNTLPALLGNTTMETFVQPSSSCIGCHSTAATLNPYGFVSSDFTFTLNDAFPKPVGPVTVPDPSPTATNPNPANLSPSQLHGLAVLENTYELVGAPWVGNKLHCTSCHLDAGTDPDAASWLGVLTTYPTTEQLEARINGCFERSMNGKALCDPSTTGEADSCDKNPTMTDIVAYMTWLDGQWDALHPGVPAPKDYPWKNGYGGDADNGAQVFLQKCAFCHGVDGQGHYASDTYYRPALWGPNSFNAAAGFGTPATLAEFLKSNMPLGAGGMLSETEAADLAAFIDNHCRPGKSTTTGPGGSTVYCGSNSE